MQKEFKMPVYKQVYAEGTERPKQFKRKIDFVVSCTLEFLRHECIDDIIITNLKKNDKLWIPETLAERYEIENVKRVILDRASISEIKIGG